MDDRPSRKLRDLIREHEITITFVHGAPPNPTFKDANTWTVTLRRPGVTSHTVPFYMGPGLVDDHGVPREPDIERVLDCQLSDANTIDSTPSYDEWCRELGFDPQSQRTTNMHRKCMDYADRLRRFLGEHYETFLYADRD